MDYYCDICDISVKIKYKKRHLNSSRHREFDGCLIDRYNIKNPDFLQIDNILKKYIRDHDKKFYFYRTITKFHLKFSNMSTIVKPSTKSKNITHGLREILLEKIKYYEDRGHIFESLTDMSIIFISCFRYMTYTIYLQIPKSMLEWKINSLLYKDPSLIEKLIPENQYPFIPHSYPMISHFTRKFYKRMNHFN